MKRRSFFALIWLLVAIANGVNAATDFAAGDTVGYAAGITVIATIALAGIYWLHPEPIDRPDQPAPRRWYEIAGLCAVALVVSLGLLAVTVGR